MADNKIKWFGKIPKYWDILPIERLYEQRNEKVSDSNYPALSVSKQGVTPQLELAAKTNAHEARKKVLRGDFVINSRSDRFGACGISDYEGSVSLINIVLIPQKGINSKYYEWLFHTVQFYEEFHQRGHGIVDDLWSTIWKDMKKINIPVPPLYEQSRIANYLNNKCKEIEEVALTIKEQINILEEYKKSIIIESVTKGINKNREYKNREYKNSNLEWVGKIPKLWNVKKGKYFLKRIVKPVKNDDEIVTCFRDGEVTLRKNRRENDFTISETEEGYQGIEEGDLVVHSMDGFSGAIGISNSRGKASPVLTVLETNENKKYIMYYLRSMAYLGVFESLSTGIRLKTCNTNWEKLKELQYILPKLQEQEEIVKHIDFILKEINSIIKDKKREIDTLLEFKRNLIYECTTGK